MTQGTLEGTTRLPPASARSRCRPLTVVIITASVALLAARYVVTKSFVAGDSAWQFSTLRSLYFQRSLDLSDEADFFYQERSPYTGNRKILIRPQPNPRTGMVTSVWPVGAVLIRLPSFAAADILSRLAVRSGLVVDTSGYRDLYQFVPALYSLALGVAGLLLLSGTLARTAGNESALAATCTVWLATPVVYYLTVEPLMAHAVSVALACGLIALALRTPPEASAGHFVALGIVCGLLAITRYQDAAYFIVPAALLWARGWSRMAAVAAGALPVIAIQLAVNQAWYGSAWVTGYAVLGVDQSWTSPQFIRHMFDPLHGIFTTHPIHLLGLAGLVWVYPAHKRLATALGLVFLAQVYVVATMPAATPGMSFGNRTITSLTPAFVLGWHSLVDRFPRLALLGALLVCANLALLALYCLRIVRDPSAF